MIGAGMMQAASSSILSSYSVVISPGSISDTTPNGAYVSPTMTAIIYNGIGPFEFDWSYSLNDFDGQLFNPTPETCQAYMSRFNESFEVNVLCVVTDTGNSNLAAVAACTLNITFE